MKNLRRLDARDMRRALPDAPIALLTDFGYRDHYAGAMKGVLASIAPDAALLDRPEHVVALTLHRPSFPDLLGNPHPGTSTTEFGRRPTGRAQRART